MVKLILMVGYTFYYNFYIILYPEIIGSSCIGAGVRGAGVDRAGVGEVLPNGDDRCGVSIGRHNLLFQFLNQLYLRQ